MFEASMIAAFEAGSTVWMRTRRRRLTHDILLQRETANRIMGIEQQIIETGYRQ
jgi:hypothetical protein